MMLIKLNKRKNIPYILSILFNFIFLFLYFLPYFKTYDSFVLGYFSFPFLQDSSDPISTSITMLILSLVFTSLLFIASFAFIFLKEEDFKKIFKYVASLYLFKFIFDVLIVVFASKVNSNIQVAFGCYLNVVLSLILAIAFIWSYINLRDDNNPIIKKKEEEEDQR